MCKLGSHTGHRCFREGCFEIFRTVCVAVAVLTAGCVGGPITSASAQAADTQPSPVPIPEKVALDPAIPTPESIIGHRLGDGAVRYEPMVRYIRALADASPLVTVTPSATSHEGRTLYFLTITSVANHARLARIKADNDKLADPRKLGDNEEAERILTDLPGIAWMAYSIHGDELSSTDAALRAAYLLAAGTDEKTRRLCDELVIHIDPLMNPDGRERYLGQLQHLTGKVSNPDFQAMQHWGLWSAGRGNHYLFDLNRDWLSQVNPETRGRSAKILEWHPHLLIDSHEMGGLDTYLFDPPREPFNENISETNLRWRRLFSADQAKAFDAHGWSYYTRDWYEEWYPGYTNAWANLQGAIGILYEQAGVNAASIKQASGQTLTYAEAVQHQVASTFANLETLRANRREILSDYLADRRWAVDPTTAKRAAFLVPPPKDAHLLQRLTDLLNRHGIEYGFAEDGFIARNVSDIYGRHSDTHVAPTDTLVVSTVQPQRRLLHALLDFDPHMSDEFLREERKDLENHRGTRIYDITAWNIAMALGLQAYWADQLDEVSLTSQPARALEIDREFTDGGYGFLLDGASSDIYVAIARLLERECRLRVATEPFTVQDRSYDAGTVLLRRHENDGRLAQNVRETNADLNVNVRRVDTALCQVGPDLGGRKFELLVPPRIAIASQWPVATTSFGATWYLLDARLGLRASPVSLPLLGAVDLRKYNVIVLPDVWRDSALQALLDEGVRKTLRNWVEAGGTLIAFGNTAAFLADAERGLSSVRLRSHVLGELAVYVEAVQRERAARRVEIDPSEVWHRVAPPRLEREDDLSSTDSKADEASSSGKELAGKGSSGDVDALKRRDQWLELFRPNGAIAAGDINTEHWLCFGLSDANGSDPVLPVLLTGRHVLMSKHPVETPVRLRGKDALRLSGLIWPEARERWADSAYATVERVGKGQIILFASDPFFRAYFEGSGRLLLNALLLGPGLGASPPLPW